MQIQALPRGDGVTQEYGPFRSGPTCGAPRGGTSWPRATSGRARSPCSPAVPPASRGAAPDISTDSRTRAGSCSQTSSVWPGNWMFAGRTPGAGVKPWVSLADGLKAVAPLAIDEIIRPMGKLAEDLVQVAPGSGVKSPGKAETTRPGGHWGYKQGAFVADPSLPARTVTASAQQDWIRDPVLGLRRFCPRECAMLQTFPSSWVFVGNRASQYRQIGNAVPPALAALVGTSLLAHVVAQPASETIPPLALLPLPEKLSSAVLYTAKDEARNGQSRRSAPRKRISKLPVLHVKAI
jgi:hypothetical protein